MGAIRRRKRARLCFCKKEKEKREDDARSARSFLADKGGYRLKGRWRTNILSSKEGGKGREEETAGGEGKSPRQKQTVSWILSRKRETALAGRRKKERGRCSGGRG